MTQHVATRNESTDSNARRAGDLAPSKDFVQYMKDYAREKPDVAALWCFGIGFVLGWKLKPW